jgi:phage tail-like protein
MSRFRLEIDGIGDFRAISVGALKTTFNMVETEEGGQDTTADISVNGYKYDPIPIERPQTEDMALADWVDVLARGVQDKRNASVFMLDTEGRDFYRIDLYECTVGDYEEFAGDSKSKEETMKEKATLRYRRRSKRILLQ